MPIQNICFSVEVRRGEKNLKTLKLKKFCTKWTCQYASTGEQ